MTKREVVAVRVEIREAPCKSADLSTDEPCISGDLSTKGGA